MVTLQEVERQLETIGANSHYWGRAEIVELQHILVPGEQLQACLFGHYEGGFASFVVTDQRLLLVDKKIFYLTVEDMRYDMISEVDFSAQLFGGTIQVCTPTKTLRFTTFKPKLLRQVTSYIQRHVMEVRHHYDPQLQQQPSLAEGFQPAPQPLQEQIQAIQPVQPVQPTQPVPAAPAIEQTPTEALNGMYATMLGNQAITGAEPLEDKTLPTPQRHNPYINPPLMIRRRIGRFGPIGTTPTT